MRVVFMGTPDFSVGTLRELLLVTAQYLHRYEQKYI